MEVENIVWKVQEDIEKFYEKNKNWVVIIRWATATGKSKLGILLNEFFENEIISADSRQIFRFMNIWTDKVGDEIMKKISHHQVNIVDPDERYTAGQRQEDTYKIIDWIHARWKIPMIVWWTWLYIDTIYKNFTLPKSEPDREFRKGIEDMETKEPWYAHRELVKIDPEEADKHHPNSIRYIIRALEIYHQTWKTKTEWFVQQNVRYPLLMIWLWREKEDSNMRINSRIKAMLKEWLIDEVKWLLEKWYDKELQSMQWIGYKETVEYLEWKYDLEKLEEYMKRATHHMAKKQRTWFRRYIAEWNAMPRENVEYKLYNLSE